MAKRRRKGGPKIYAAPVKRVNKDNTDICINSPQSFLCNECLEIDLERVFNLTWDELEYDGRPVSAVRTAFDHSCSLCQLILSIMNVRISSSHTQNGEALQEEHGVYLRAFGTRRVLGGGEPSAEDKQQQRVLVAVLPGLPNYRMRHVLNQSILRWSSFRGLIFASDFTYAQDEPTCSKLQYGCRSIDANAVNFNVLRQWMAKSTKPETRSISFQAFVIDCEANRIVPLTTDVRYLALSYVWGQQPDFGLLEWFDRETRKLPQELPSTIADAITITRSVNERYLWIDRYCIPKWVDQHVQINNMDLIYQGAVATIVPLSRDPAQSSESGIYGLSLPRNTQPRVDIGSRFLSTSFPHLSHYLSTSTWNKRAWTMQEGILSSRCLFFTEDQVIFASADGILCESMNFQCCVEYLTRWYGKYGSNLLSSLQGVEYELSTSDREDINDSTALTGILTEYTKRALSYESDVLKAFQGILRLFQQRSFWGVFCVAPRLESEAWMSYFRWGLCWVSCSPLERGISQRRTSFPSWSWASLRGPIRFLSPGDYCNIGGPDIEAFIGNGSTNASWRHVDDVLNTEGEESYCKDDLSESENHLGEYSTKAEERENLSKSLRVQGIMTKAHIKLTSDKVSALLMVGGDGWGCDSCSAYIDNIDSENFLHRLREGSEWDVILINNDVPSDMQDIWLILDWVGDTARRIGVLEIYGTMTELIDQNPQDFDARMRHYGTNHKDWVGPILWGGDAAREIFGPPRTIILM